MQILRNSVWQNIPLRGHRDSIKSSINKKVALINSGNPVKLLQYRIKRENKNLENQLHNASVWIFLSGFCGIPSQPVILISCRFFTFYSMVCEYTGTAVFSMLTLNKSSGNICFLISTINQVR